MSAIQERRRVRLAAWVANHGGHAECARKFGLTGSQASYLSQVLNGYSLAEKSARAWEGRLRMPLNHLDQEDGPQVAETPPTYVVAHEMSHLPFTLPPTLSWEAVMQSKELPARFVVQVPDAALEPNLPRGTEVVFERASQAAPGECVLVEDGQGGRYVRRYVQGVGGAFKAQAINDAYVTLESARDGLTVLAVMAWRAERRV